VAIVHGEVRFEGAPSALREGPAGAAAALSNLLEREAQKE
jgi:hypothetical protein